MGCDMVVALGQTTGDGPTLFGQNCHRPVHECQSLQLVPGRDFALGEKVHTQFLELPQARKTGTVLGLQAHGSWGYHHGVNEHQLTAGCATLKTKLFVQAPGLLGTDLVRLVLERCRGARQAVDLLTDLVDRHGQGMFPGCPEQVEGDQAFLIADPQEAFAIETTGHSWVSQEVHQVRAVSDVSVIRQDWDRISPGLAGHAIDQGWWPGDGTKLDFAGTLNAAATGLASGLLRWGRATRLLEEQNGHIDGAFLRRLLADHYEGTRDEFDPLDASPGPTPLCRHTTPASGTATAASLITALRADPSRLPVSWCAFGPPCAGVYLPLFLDGDLPGPLAQSTARPSPDCLWWRVQDLQSRLSADRESWERTRDSLDHLQTHLDQEAEGVVVEGGRLKQQGDLAEVRRRTSYFMQHVVEQFETTLAQLETTSLQVAVNWTTAGHIS